MEKTLVCFIWRNFYFILLQSYQGWSLLKIEIYEEFPNSFFLKKDQKPSGFIPLQGCSVQRCNKKPFAFVISHPQRRHFYLYSSTEAGKKLFVCFKKFVFTKIHLIWSRYVWLVTSNSKCYFKRCFKTIGTIGWILEIT